MDGQIRTLARRTSVSGTLEDAVELLRARLRAGELTPDALERAAWLGHRASRRLTGLSGPGPELDPIARAEHVATWDRQAVARALELLLRRIVELIPADGHRATVNETAAVLAHLARGKEPEGGLGAMKRLLARGVGEGSLHNGHLIAALARTWAGRHSGPTTAYVLTHALGCASTALSEQTESSTWDPLERVQMELQLEDASDTAQLLAWLRARRPGAVLAAALALARSSAALVSAWGGHPRDLRIVAARELEICAATGGALARQARRLAQRIVPPSGPVQRHSCFACLRDTSHELARCCLLVGGTADPLVAVGHLEDALRAAQDGKTYRIAQLVWKELQEGLVLHLLDSP